MPIQPRLNLYLFFILSFLMHGLFVIPFFVTPLRPETFPAAPIEINVLVTSTRSTADGRKSGMKHSGRAQDSMNPIGEAPESVAAETGYSEELISASALGIRTEYPKLSRALGEEGKVIIKVTHRESADLQISVSSGFPRLDQAALGALREAMTRKILSARSENFNVTFLFRLND